MKRWLVTLLIAAAIAGTGSAADISGLGRDFETVIDRLGAEMIPNLQQAAIWGQFPGVATLPDGTRFFFTLTGGALLSDGILKFTGDTTAFEVLNVPNLIDGVLSGAGDTAQNLFQGIQGFFPYPMLRTAFGLALPGGIEAMVDVAGFPQFLTGFISGFAGIDALTLNTLHIGTRVRKGIVRDAGPFPAVSVGVGYGYGGMNIGYDLSAIGGGGEYGSIDVELGELNLKGALGIASRVHSFGLDLHASKAFGFLVPFVVVSPYYHLASFSGGIAGFDAYIDFNDGGSEKDIEYNGTEPDTAWVDNDLSLVLAGGFDLVFGRSVLQLHGSWNVLKGSPGVTVGVRWQ